jgi:acyl carrier protein
MFKWFKDLFKRPPRPEPSQPMSDDELSEKFKKLIADRLEIDESKIKLDSSFRNDLGADSLDTYELIYAAEEEFGVSIPDQKANEFETVREALDFVKAQLGKSQVTRA